jgi:hypothetical protein
VWAESEAQGDTRIMGLRLSGGAPFVVALLSGITPAAVYAAGDVAGWRVNPVALFDSYLQTALVPGSGTPTAAGSGTMLARAPGPGALPATRPEETR